MQLLLRELGSSHKWLLEGCLWLRFVPSNYVELLVDTAWISFAVAVGTVERTLKGASFWCMSRLFRLWLSILGVPMLWLASRLVIVHLDRTFLVLELLEGHRWYEWSCCVRTAVSRNIISFIHACIRHFSGVSTAVLNYHIICSLLPAVHHLCLVHFNINNF